MVRKSEIKKEPIDLLKPIIEALGYELNKKKRQDEIIKPSNADELEKLIEEELKTRMTIVNEEIMAAEKNLANTKNDLLEHFKKEGPTEFTKALFSGTAIPVNRLNIVSDNLNDLKLQKGYIEILLKEKRKQKIIATFSDCSINSIDIVQGPVGTIMQIKVE